jgi:hypothetical protein
MRSYSGIGGAVDAQWSRVMRTSPRIACASARCQSTCAYRSSDAARSYAASASADAVETASPTESVIVTAAYATRAGHAGSW